MAVWYTVLNFVLHIAGLAYFIWLAIELNNVLNATPLPSSINKDSINALYIISIILAILAGLSCLIIIIRFFRGNHLPSPAQHTEETLLGDNYMYSNNMMY